MDPVKLAVLLAGAFFLSFGVAAYRHFYTVLGAAAGMAMWMAVADTLVQLPGLKEHPGTAGLMLLLLLLLTGVFLAVKLRRLLAFLGGFGTGLVLSRAFGAFMAGGSLPGKALSLAHIDAMNVLAALLCGVLFLFFERFFAVVLTSAVGSYLCAWALGGKWTFAACMILGLLAQPLIFLKFRPSGKKTDGRTRGGGTTTALVLLLSIALPGEVLADWVVDRVNTNTAGARIVIAAGWRDGVKKGVGYAVVDGSGSLVTVFTVDEIFSGSSYSEALAPETAPKVRQGMRVLEMEEYEYSRAMASGGETSLVAFVEKYPDSRHRQKVLDALDETRYRFAELSGTIEAFREFQRRYPTSRYGARARGREEELTFKKAWETGTEGAFSDFLKRFPDTALVSGMSEVRAFLKTRKTGKVFAYQDFLAAYPRGRLAGEFIPYIDDFEMWAEKLEFGSEPAQAIRYFGELGDETAVPYLVGKLTVRELESEAREAIQRIGEPALNTLMEVLISPLQSIELKDKVAVIIGGIGDLSAIPAMRSYVDKENTRAGREALLMLEERAGR